MVGICCGDADGLKKVVFWYSNIGGPVMVVFCCSSIDGLVMIEFDSECMCWRVQQYVFPCDSSR